MISCYDRAAIRGIFRQIRYDGGMTSYLYKHKICIFDYPNFADELRGELQSNAERIAETNELEIEFIRKK